MKTATFVKRVQRTRDAEEMQPWRCSACGTAVRRGYNDPCKCIPEAGKGASGAPDPGGSANIR
jgi:hypothetical protein